MLCTCISMYIYIHVIILQRPAQVRSVASVHVYSTCTCIHVHVHVYMYIHAYSTCIYVRVPAVPLKNPPPMPAPPSPKKLLKCCSFLRRFCPIRSSSADKNMLKTQTHVQLHVSLLKQTLYHLNSANHSTMHMHGSSTCTGCTGKRRKCLIEQKYRIHCHYRNWLRPINER